jgi:hypothetical protein
MIGDEKERKIAEIKKERVRTQKGQKRLGTFHFVHPVVFQFNHYITSVTTQRTIRILKHLQFLQHVSAIQLSSGKMT